MGVDRKDDIRDFLISRRAKISPEQAGLPSYGELRRVPGLRREEVAQLAGVSTDYYTRLAAASVESPTRCWKRSPLHFTWTRRSART